MPNDVPFYEDLPNGARRLDDAVASIRHEPSAWKRHRGTPSPTLLFAAWEDGYTVWTENGIFQSDANFVFGKICTDRFEDAKSILTQLGAFADETLRHVRCGIDCPYEIRRFRYGDKTLDMRGQDHGIWSGIGAEERNLSNLAQLPPDDLRYLFAWTVLETTITSLRPSTGSTIKGRLGYCRLDTIWIPN
ncbi:MAG: hypothetical protein U0930_17765 [Pirellulales bacterium]